MFFKTTCDGWIICITSARARIDDDIDGRQLMLVKPKRFSDQAFDAIAPHGIANESRRHRQSESCCGATIGTNENRKLCIGETSRIFVDAIEVRFVMKSLRRSERSR